MSGVNVVNVAELHGISSLCVQCLLLSTSPHRESFGIKSFLYKSEPNFLGVERLQFDIYFLVLYKIYMFISNRQF